jgi:hypothetical protein
MVDEMRMMKGIRHLGVKEEFAHVTAVAGRALSRQGRKDRGERYDNVPNVEMWELEKEMDKDGRVVFGLGWATREG